MQIFTSISTYIFVFQQRPTHEKRYKSRFKTKEIPGTGKVHSRCLHGSPATRTTSGPTIKQ